MIEHKAYECEYCGQEFDYEEREDCLRHETDCNCNPKLKRCGACTYGETTIHYDTEFIRCTRRRPVEGTCENWANKIIKCK